VQNTYNFFLIKIDAILTKDEEEFLNFKDVRSSILFLFIGNGSNFSIDKEI